jgi:hypothetical protein
MRGGRQGKGGAHQGLREQAGAWTFLSIMRISSCETKKQSSRDWTKQNTTKQSKPLVVASLRNISYCLLYFTMRPVVATSGYALFCLTLSLSGCCCYAVTISTVTTAFLSYFLSLYLTILYSLLDSGRGRRWRPP